MFDSTAPRAPDAAPLALITCTRSPAGQRLQRLVNDKVLIHHIIAAQQAPVSGALPNGTDGLTSESGRQING